MASLLDDRIWQSILGPDTPLNPEAAIYRLWVAYRDGEQFLGAPITLEVEVAPGVVQQAFSSGAVIEWNAESGARLVSS